MDSIGNGQMVLHSWEKRIDQIGPFLKAHVNDEAQLAQLRH